MQLPIDLPSITHLALTFLALAFAFLFLLRTASSRYLRTASSMLDSPQDLPLCVVCGLHASKTCSACKAVRYCSATCQVKHWQSGHKSNCQEFKLKAADRKRFSFTSNTFRSSLSPSTVICKKRRSAEKVLFSYDEFIKLFNWKGQAFPPCGLLNCGNSCFANVVLQCLACTRPLVAYFLESNHASKCWRRDWCFLCELQFHIQRVRQSRNPFSPLNILSRLPNICGSLECGSQEDAHEFMRFAIDTMQSVCLDEFGGEKEVDPSVQETTLINHIFGGQLSSQVVCSKCGKISYRHENMMDLTVEIQGDASCLEECLNQFTKEEQLDGDNLYKCDGCDGYVKAWKRLTINQAPNILTVALKRFQGGRFGKLNKRVTFPETLDLSPYMSDAEEDGNIYRLYAVVVHIDMLNASFFGHYICFVKDFSGNWYRVDDCKVIKVELEDVLGQAAYMLMYSRDCYRPYMVKRLNMKQNEETFNSSSKDLHLNLSAQSSFALINSENLSVVSGRKVSDSDQSDERTQRHGLTNQDTMVDFTDIAQGRDLSILTAAALSCKIEKVIDNDVSGCKVSDSDQSDEGAQIHGLTSQSTMVDSTDIAQGRDSSIHTAAVVNSSLSCIMGKVIDNDQCDEETQKHGLTSQNTMVDSIDIVQGRDSNNLSAAVMSSSLSCKIEKDDPSNLSAAVMSSSLSCKIEKDESLHHSYVSNDASFIQDKLSFLSSCGESDAGASSSTLREKINASVVSGSTEFFEDVQTDISDTDFFSLDCSTSTSSLTEDRISTLYAQYEDKKSSPEAALKLKVLSVLEKESSMKHFAVKNGVKKSNSGKNASKPLFSPGFLDKPFRSKSSIDTGKNWGGANGY